MTLVRGVGMVMVLHASTSSRVLIQTRYDSHFVSHSVAISSEWTAATTYLFHPFVHGVAIVRADVIAPLHIKYCTHCHEEGDVSSSLLAENNNISWSAKN